MANTNTYTIIVIGRRAWWLRSALAALKVWALVTRRMPSDALIQRIARRGIHTSIAMKRDGR
ncbi:hypothetical protein [Burkholderia gladioli]|uniref:hypothetical protein n=1 Tax=Burkholderia gladioli TaxID=28095 RepID=UPI00163E95C6|nr:hypothetical protein [Burkholderia gladioli]